MKRLLSCLAAVTVFAICGLGTASGQQEPRKGTVIVPPTSVQRPEDIGVRAHTNFLIFVPAAKRPGAAATGASPTGYETPGSLSCVYQTWADGQIQGCPVSGNYTGVGGGSKTIAIVDAYDYPTACNDFNYFSNEFGLPQESNNCINQSASNSVFNVVYAGGSKPSANCGWAQEEALDIEWAHAMAPNAKIILVEAASNSNSDLLNAVQVAGNLVAKTGGQVSMSWGGSEFRGESTYDTYFETHGVTYFASSGDSGSKVIWPSASSNVISAGGTSVNRNSSGNFTNETVWSSAGGGASRFVPVPSYQSTIYSLSQLLGNSRGTPDISFDADPNTGVSVYDSTSCQGYVDWMVFGGTSVSSPSLAGIANESGAFDGGWDSGTNSSSVQGSLYQNYSTASNGGTSCNYTSPFFDVTSGSSGRYSAAGCWDFASGIGTIRGKTGFASGGGGTSSPSFSLSATPSSLTVTQSSSTSSKITITSSNSYAGTVNLTLIGCPSGATCSLSASSVAISGNTAQSVTLSINTGSAQTGTSNLVIQGTDSSDSTLTSSVTVPLTVNSASTTGGDFSISVSPGNAVVKGNGTATYSVSISSLNGYTGTVALSVVSAPIGPTGTFSAGSVSSTSPSSTLTVKTNSAPRGNYTLTITGTDSSNNLNHSTTVGLKIH